LTKGAELESAFLIKTAKELKIGAINRYWFVEIKNYLHFLFS